jgi:hypothetical protein
MSPNSESFDDQLERRIRAVSEADDPSGALTAADYRSLCIVTLAVPAVLLIVAWLS